MPAKKQSLGCTDRQNSYLHVLLIHPLGSFIELPLPANPSLPDSFVDRQRLSLACISPLPGKGCLLLTLPLSFLRLSTKEIPQVPLHPGQFLGAVNMPSYLASESLACKLSLVCLITQLVVFRGNNSALRASMHMTLPECVAPVSTGP